MDTLLDGARRPAQASTPLDCQVSTYASATDRHGATATLRDCLTGQAFDTQAHELAAQIAATFDKDTRSQLKKRLPAFTPAGTFAPTRGATNLQAYTGLIPLDFDNCDVSQALAVLAAQPFIAYASPSVSGTGAVALALVDTSAERHGQAFDALAAHFEALGLPPDRATRDVSRLRFFAPWCEGLSFINDAAKPFTVPEVPRPGPNPAVPEWPKPGPPNPTPGPFPPPVEHGSRVVDAVISEIEARRLDLTQDYSAWIRIGYALANEYGQSGRNYFHRLSQFYPAYDATETDAQFSAILQSASGANGIGTFIGIAKDAGIDVKAIARALGTSATQSNPPASTPRPQAAATFQAANSVADVASELADFARQHNRTLIKAPTGSGKTYALAHWLAPQLGKTLFVFPLRRLAEQQAIKFYGERTACLAGPRDPSGADVQEALQKPIVFASYDRAVTDGIAPEFETIVIDEAHELVSGYHYRGATIRGIEAIANDAQRVIAVSATPPRLYALDEYALADVQVTNTPPLKFATYEYERGARDSTALKLAQEAGARADGLAVLQLQDKAKLEEFSEALQAQGFPPQAIEIFYSTDSGQENDALRKLIETETIAAQTRIILTTSVIEVGVNLNCPDRHVRMIFCPQEYDAKSFIQFAARARTYQSHEAIALLSSRRNGDAPNTTDVESAAAKIYQRNARYWQSKADLLNAQDAFEQELSAYAIETKRPALNTGASDWSNCIIATHQADGSKRFAINRPALMADAYRQARRDLSNKAFTKEVQALAPHARQHTITLQADSDSAALEGASNKRKARQERLNDFVKARLYDSWDRCLRVAAGTQDFELQKALKSTWGIKGDYFDSDARNLLSEAETALADHPHARQATREMIEAKISKLASFRALGFSDAAALEVIAPHDSQGFASSAETDRAKAQVRTAILLELHQAAPDALDAREKQDAKDLEALKSEFETGAKYSTDQIIEKIEGRWGKERRRDGRQALQVLRLMFDVKPCYSKARDANGQRKNVRRYELTQAIDWAVLEQRFSIDRSDIIKLFNFVECGHTGAPSNSESASGTSVATSPKIRVPFYSKLQ